MRTITIERIIIRHRGCIGCARQREQARHSRTDTMALSKTQTTSGRATGEQTEYKIFSY